MNLFDVLKDMTKEKYPWQKFYKKEERDITVPELSIYDYLLQNNELNLGSIAINYFNNKTTYRELFERINLCARALKSQGVREGDVVTICMANTPEAVISFYAVNKIGAVANMLHPLSAEEEIKFSLKSTKSVLLIAMDLCYDRIKNIIDDTKIYKTVIVSASNSMPKVLSLGYYVTKGYKINSPNKSENYIYWHDFIERGKHYTDKVNVEKGKDDIAVILHSGGTTGVPKNINLTNGNINAVIEQAKIIFPNISVGDRFLSILPLFHCFGLVVCVHAPLCLGSTAILIPQFDAKRFDKLLRKYQPTVIAGVPTLFEALLENAYMDNVDMSYVNYVISGGDTLSVAKNEKVNEFLKEHNCNTTLMQGYGMTETTGPVCFGSLGSDRLGSVGIPLPGNIIKIVEPTTGIEVAPLETGEICITGPTIMTGYLNNIKETNNILRKHDDGKLWIHSGDLGYMNEEGVFFFVQRLKRMLIVSGYNVYPSYIEEVIMEHPLVANCGVIGIPHPYKVQVPKAFIVLKEDVEVNSEIRREIKEHCERKLAKYMIPKEFEFRNSLPKTMIGKINYKDLEK